ncbi:MAG: M23 family metallopeptidase [Clostridium sp.]|nr:M23 family metallopeptidase [Clostridium sp.]
MRRSSAPKHKGDFVRRPRYRLALENLSALSRVWEFKASRRGMALAAVALFAATGVFWFVIYVYTPLRGVLPVGMSYDLREDYDEMSLRLDSALEAQRIADAYTQNIERVLLLSADTALSTTDPQPTPQEASTPKLLPLDSLIEASAAERSFVSRFEQAERYNLSVLSPIVAEGMTFFPPIAGIPIEDRVSDAGIPSIAAAAGRVFPVSAAYRGTVLNSYFTTGRGLTLVVQHPNDFVSIYSGLSETFASRGDKLNAGARVGLAGKYPFSFELWHNGSPLPVRDYIMMQ